MSDEDEVTAVFAALFEGADQDSARLDEAFQAVVNAGVVGRVVVHRVICRPRGCVLGTVIKVGGRVLCRTRDYKFSPGLNLTQSVESARRKNTLNGRDHWPGHTFDVVALAEWGPFASMDMNCRHVRHSYVAADLLDVVRDVPAGHPNKPTILGASSIRR